jgi:hypothetical protein
MADPLRQSSTHLGLSFDNSSPSHHARQACCGVTPAILVFVQASRPCWPRGEGAGRSPVRARRASRRRTPSSQPPRQRCSWRPSRVASSVARDSHELQGKLCALRKRRVICGWYCGYVGPVRVVPCMCGVGFTYHRESFCWQDTYGFAERHAGGFTPDSTSALSRRPAVSPERACGRR